MGIRSTPEVQPGPLQPGLQIAAPKREPVLQLPPPAARVHPADEPGDVDELTPRLQGGLPQIIQDPD